MDEVLMQTRVGDNSKKKEKRRRRRERKKQAKKHEAQIRNQINDNLDTSEKRRDYEVANNKSNTDLLETDLSLQRDCKPGTDTSKVNLETGLTETLSEGNANKTRKKRLRKKKNKEKVEDESQSTSQTNTDAGSIVNLVEGNVTSKRKRNRKRKKKATIDDGSQSLGQTNTVARSTENIVEGNVTGKRIKKREKIKKAEIKDLNVVFSSFDVKDAERFCPEKAPITSIRRKLLVLDVNGLLADIVMPPPKNFRADTRISGRAIFRRPFLDDFLKFCFRNFDVGIWSSRNKIIIHKVVDYLLGGLKHKLLFCWDMSHCTQTGFRTLENCHKPLVCKELRKIWESDDPNLGWKTGEYDESNTLLLDDSPYKALLNPLNTAIFPYSYSFKDKNDNSLGPRGDLRVSLEGLLTCENVQKYVEQHPIGQKAINDRDLSWGFYSGVLHRMSNG